MIDNYRPGVYSSYDVTSFYATASGAKYAAVVAKADGGEVNKLYSFGSYAEAAEVFSGGAAPMRGILKVLFESGVGRVYAVAADNGYKQALALLEEVNGIGAVVCDGTAASDLEELRASVERSSKQKRERVAFCGIDEPAAAIAAAKALCSERVCLCGTVVSPREMTQRGTIYCAAAVAGVVLASGDAAHNFNGEVLRTVREPEKTAESDIQSLLAAGVTVVEQSGGAARIVRALTTRTMTGGVDDRSMSGLNTILIIDSVIVGVRDALELRLRGSRVSGGKSLESIASQVTVELAAKQDNGLIESFLAPKVYPHEADPAVCVVELSFKVAHVLSQIHVVAHIQV